MLGVNSTIVKECLMLGHTVSKRNIVILAPSTKRVQKKDRVLEALLEELLTGVLEQENVAIMEGVANLESVNGISVLGLDLLRDF
jgi:nickel-dependent lactate racemase